MKLNKSQQTKLDIILNWILFTTHEEATSEAVEQATQYIEEDHVDEVIESGFIGGDELESYLDTHYEMVQAITQEWVKDNPNKVISDVQAANGHRGLYALAKQWTDEFQELHKDTEWDGQFWDEIDNFTTKKLA